MKKPLDQTLDEVLAENSRTGLVERLAEIRKLRELTDEDVKIYEERLEEELNCIKQMGFPGYFLIVADFINWGKDHNIPVGPGTWVGGWQPGRLCHPHHRYRSDPL